MSGGLWDEPLVSPRQSIQRRFDAWVATPDGQEVYANCLRRARALYERGHRHFGIKAIWEAARYDHALRVGPDADGYKLCNDYHSRMARYMLEHNAWLRDANDGAGFFSLRELRA